MSGHLLRRDNNEIEFSDLDRDEVLRCGGHNVRVTHYRSLAVGRCQLKTSIMNKNIARGYWSALKHDGYQAV